MPRWSPCKRQDFIRRLHQLGFEGVYSGAKHQFMTIGQNRLTLPSDAEYSVPMVRIMLREVEQLLGREISLEEWSRLS
jgi:predicted RNA binding protein YcfA (HicA-like mRNA interferase family)